MSLHGMGGMYFVNYNPGKNDWDTLSDLGEKETRIPRCNVDPTHVVRNLGRSHGVGILAGLRNIDSLFFLWMHKF